jgi:SAM-dependent methyltransferase
MTDRETGRAADTIFASSVPALYEKYLVPLIFQPYADDLARRVAALRPSKVLEIAAGTGVVTRALAAALPTDVAITATDLNQAMLDEASARGTVRPVNWRQADAMQLPFEDRSFDAVVCQFGVMFFPGKAAAFAEARRVLTSGGSFLFNVWDTLESNEIPHVVIRALESVFPDNPPRFLARVPHGYHDRQVIRRDLAAGGFTASPAIETVAARSRASSAREAAVAFCQGTPLRNEIEARDASALLRATHAAAQAVEARFGRGSVDAGIKAHVITAHRD